MENTETGPGAEPEKRGPGKPAIEGLITRSFAVDADDYAWFMARYKGEVLPDGTKNNINRVLRQIMRDHRERVEKKVMKYSRKRLLAGQWIAADLKTDNFTEAELKEIRLQRDPVHQEYLADAEMAEARQADMEQAVGRIRKHGPGLPLLSRSFGEMPREDIEALAVQLSEDGSIVCRYLDRALEEIERLRADVEAEYELAQALLREREGL